MATTNKFFAVFVLSLMSIDFSGPLILKAREPTPKVLASRQLDDLSDFVGFIGNAILGLLSLIWELFKFLGKARIFSGRSGCQSGWRSRPNKPVSYQLVDACCDLAFKKKRNRSYYDEYRYRANRALSLQSGINDSDKEGLEEISYLYSKTMVWEDKIEKAVWAEYTPDQFKNYIKDKAKAFENNVKEIQKDIKTFNDAIKKFKENVTQLNQNIPKLKAGSEELKKAQADLKEAQAEISSHTNLIEMKEKDLKIITDENRKERIVSMVTMACRSFRQKIEDEFNFKNDQKAKAEYDKALGELESADPAVSDAANLKIASLFDKLESDSADKLMKANAMKMAKDLVDYGMKAEEVKDPLAKSVLKTFIILMMKTQMMLINKKMKAFQAKKSGSQDANSAIDNPLAAEILTDFKVMKAVVNDLDKQELSDN